ncbi:MAG: glutathione S-transferase [Rhodospirillales bacterium 69-11]|nr:glutathione S-transferase N-terminal domain-containing protein [Rhodospirillales bacterium]MBN8925314.1 glutathione S-transferase N-terminal domain-containing protein [Rhodospirillales bacterium]OJW24294.1 MAG: glutathione S-transferase [Rhodospirillales bacterium 69-11]
MKLFYSATSPYVRKVMACAITRGLENRIEKVPTNPHQSPPELLAANPLSKVTCLVTDDGLALFDSPVICEYLDSRGEALPLFPSHGAARWRALKFQAMADGILDAAVTGRGELGKPKEAARDATIARFKAAISNTLDALEADPPHRLVDIGSIAVACALGYLDFRYASDPWRERCPKLAAWYEAFAQNPGLAQTAPKE